MRRMSETTKIKNAALLLLGAAGPLTDAKTYLLDQHNLSGFSQSAIAKSTFGMVHTDGSAGQFNLQSGLEYYGPPIAAIALGKLISILRRRFKV